MITCDYLVIGAGAASLGFVDTLLADLPSAKVVIVDKNPAPGGQWNDAYDFVRLHQPSLLYGVASKQLEGHWMRLMMTNLTLPWNHRATKKEILAYFKKIVDEWVRKGQVTYYPRCVYDFKQEINDNLHYLSSLNGNRIDPVKVNVKLVNGVLGECKVPSRCSVEFPVDEGVNVVTPNELYQNHHRNGNPMGQQYIILGAGKTAMDTIVYLQTQMKISPDLIRWIIPNDVWMMIRGTSHGGPWSYPRAVLKCNGDIEKACAMLSNQGSFGCLDDEVQPTRFRFPVVGKDELLVMRKIRNVLRRGRVTSIKMKQENKVIVVDFESEKQPIFLPLEHGQKYTFVHCTSPGPFNGNDQKELFVSEKELDLVLLFAPPISLSMSCLAKLESARREGTMDIEFGRKLLMIKSNNCELELRSDENHLTENDILKSLLCGFYVGGDKNAMLQTIINLAMFIALVDNDPMVGYKWLTVNRLSMLAVPGFKCGIYDDLNEMVVKREVLGLSNCESEMLTLLSNRLSLLEGK